MGYKFSLVLSREITDDESIALQEAGCAGAVFTNDSHPTEPAVTVTKMDFDDTVSPSLTEAIEAALEAVGAVPDLTVPSMRVPAQPADATDRETSAEADRAALAIEAPEQESPAQESEAAAVETAVVKKSPSKKAEPRKGVAKKKATPASEHVPDPVESDAVTD